MRAGVRAGEGGGALVGCTLPWARGTHRGNDASLRSRIDWSSVWGLCIIAVVKSCMHGTPAHARNAPSPPHRTTPYRNVPSPTQHPAPATGPLNPHPGAGGTRTCIHTPGAALEPGEMTSGLLAGALEGAALVYFDGRLTEAALLLAREARRRGIPVGPAFLWAARVGAGEAAGLGAWCWGGTGRVSA